MAAPNLSTQTSWALLVLRLIQMIQCEAPLLLFRAKEPVIKLVLACQAYFSVVPAQAGTQGFQSLAPCSCQGQALGPRFRGGDEFGCAWNWITASCAGMTMNRNWITASFAGTTKGIFAGHKRDPNSSQTLRRNILVSSGGPR